MSRLSKLMFCIAIWIFTLGSVTAAPEMDPAFKIPQYAQMAQKATEQGTIKVIVQLDVPDYESYAAASAQFKGVRTEAASIVRAAAADVALTNRINAAADDLLSRMAGGIQIDQRYSAFPIMALEVSPEALGALARDPQVTHITENRLLRPFLDNTVGIIGATDAWTSGYSGNGWYVAILDTGIRSSHEFFTGKTIVEACYSSVSHCPNSGTSQTGPGSAAHHPDTYAGWDHGTHVAGIAAGNNGSLYGVARDADIIAIQVFSRFDNDPYCAPDDDCVLAYDADILAGLNYIYSLRSTYSIAAINLSLGSGSYSSNCDSTYSSYATAIDQLRSAGIATVAASGNGGSCSGIGAPACISSAISVGATTDADAMTDFSDYSATLLDLLAPGDAINASVGDTDTSYESWSGTSMATPHVTGAFALIREADGVTPVADVLTALIDSGEPATGSANCSNDGITLPVPRIKVDEAINVLLLPPDAPDGLAATASDSDQIDLSWNDNSGNEQGFKIERKTGAGGTYAQIADVGPNTTSYSDQTGLSEMTTYYYQIRSYNGVADSAYTTEAQATTLMGAPSSFTAAAISSSQINLAWTDNTSLETGFEIERRTGTGGSYSQIATVGADAQSYSDSSGLSAGNLYGYRIRSINGGSASIYVETSATTPITNTQTSRSSSANSGGCFISDMMK